jgi:hypothetical protein
MHNDVYFKYITMHMGRPSKYKHHPLYRLRESLGGPAGPWTQSDLARLLDIPFITLQCAESGRRGEREVPSSILEKIHFHIGVTWDEAKREWLFDQRLLLRSGLTPLTPDLFAQYRAIVDAPPRKDQRDLDTVFCQAWQEELLKRIPDKYWRLFTTRYIKFIELSIRDFHAADQIQFFEEVAEKSEPVLAAVYEFGHKGLSKADHFQQVLQDCHQALATLGPDSEGGAAFMEALQELLPHAPAIIKKLSELDPPVDTTKSTGRRHKAKLPQ